MANHSDIVIKAQQEENECPLYVVYNKEGIYQFIIGSHESTIKARRLGLSLEVLDIERLPFFSSLAYKTARDF